MPRGKTTTKLCSVCSKNVSMFAYNRHVNSHSKIKNSKPKRTVCQYCGGEYLGKTSLGNHETRCKLNSNRKIQVTSEEGKKRGLAKKQENGTLHHTTNTKKKISDAIKKAVLLNPNAYTSSNRGRTKQIIVDGIKLQGKWEEDFYLWAKKNNLSPQRPITAFQYKWNGDRWYHPDFYIPSLNLYVEVKGYETERDRQKWLQFPEKLRIIKKLEISQIRNGTFAGL